MKITEYKVRAVTRYVVTQYMSDPENGAGAVITMGEFDCGDYASRVCDALSKADPGPTLLPTITSREQGADDSMARDGRKGEWYE